MCSPIVLFAMLFPQVLLIGAFNFSELVPDAVTIFFYGSEKSSPSYENTCSMHTCYAAAAVVVAIYSLNSPAFAHGFSICISGEFNNLVWMSKGSGVQVKFSIFAVWLADVMAGLCRLCSLDLVTAQLSAILTLAFQQSEDRIHDLNNNLSFQYIAKGSRSSARQ